MNLLEKQVSSNGNGHKPHQKDGDIAKLPVVITDENEVEKVKKPATEK